MFLYIVVSYNQNFSKIKNIFQKTQKNTKGAFDTFFWGKK